MRATDFEKYSDTVLREIRKNLSNYKHDALPKEIQAYLDEPRTTQYAISRVDKCIAYVDAEIIRRFINK